ncbi:MAG: hypothetical protein FJ027_19465 [Candidatus Rokubacteria bacterium]|nr:hypothetical protein [Candidatus Rokubacteria bacterium]
MIRRIALAVCAFALLGATAAAAQHVVTGTVVRVDQPAGVVVLDNGQMYQATPQTVFLVNNQPMAFGTFAPGTPVVVQHGQPVVLRDGRYVVMSQSAPVAAPAPVAAAPVPVAGGYEVSGVVKYADPVRRIVRFEDGRNISIDENVQLLANGSPAVLSTVRPGTFVVARSSKPLAFRGDTYYTTAAPAGTVVAQHPHAYTGTVVRVDQPNLIVLNDGRVIPATAQTVVVVDNRAVPVTALQPGTHVVVYPNGQTATVGDPAALPYGVVAPEAGLREREMERNAP